MRLGYWVLVGLEYRMDGDGVWVDWDGARMGRGYWTLVGTGGLETGMVVLEIGLLDTGGTGGLETGMVVLETGMVVLEIGVPDTGGTGGVETRMVVLETGMVVLVGLVEWR